MWDRTCLYSNVFFKGNGVLQRIIHIAESLGFPAPPPPPPCHPPAPPRSSAAPVPPSSLRARQAFLLTAPWAPSYIQPPQPMGAERSSRETWRRRSRETRAASRAGLKGDGRARRPGPALRRRLSLLSLLPPPKCGGERPSAGTPLGVGAARLRRGPLPAHRPPGVGAGGSRPQAGLKVAPRLCTAAGAPGVPEPSVNPESPPAEFFRLPGACRLPASASVSRRPAQSTLTRASGNPVFVYSENVEGVKATAAPEASARGDGGSDPGPAHGALLPWSLGSPLSGHPD